MWSEVNGGIIGAIVAGLAASPALVSNVVGTKYHDMSSVGINNNAGAFVEVRATGALASAVRQVELSYTAGEPLAFRAAADATAAGAQSSDLFVINQGDGLQSLNVQIAAGLKLFVRSLSATAVATGYITINFLG